jgi:hypothetical protein
MSKITKKQLVGNWTLVSSTTEFEGKKAHALIDSGRITYTQDGTMFANLTIKIKKDTHFKKTSSLSAHYNQAFASNLSTNLR